MYTLAATFTTTRPTGRPAASIWLRSTRALATTGTVTAKPSLASSWSWRDNPAGFRSSTTRLSFPAEFPKKFEMTSRRSFGQARSWRYVQGWSVSELVASLFWSCGFAFLKFLSFDLKTSSCSTWFGWPVTARTKPTVKISDRSGSHHVASQVSIIHAPAKKAAPTHSSRFSSRSRTVRKIYSKLCQSSKKF